MGVLKAASFLAVAAAFAVQLTPPDFSWTQLRSGSVPERHPYRTLHNIWSESQLKDLTAFVEGIGRFPTSARDMTSEVDNIGEASPLVDGKCERPLMVPNMNRSYCILPDRIDVASHYIKTGGRAGFKEGLPMQISRMLTFLKFFHAKDIASSGLDDVVSTLFGLPEYKAAVSEVCEGREVLDPFQISVILQVPGQQVPMHFDAPWFWGASRFTLPQWLLVVMLRSGLWEDRRVRQLQGVAYVHDWINATSLPEGEIGRKLGGGFFFYPEGPAGPVKVFEPRQNSAILCDGSVMVHGTDPFAPIHEPLSPTDTTQTPALPLLSKDVVSELVHVGGGMWDLVSDGVVKQKYRSSDLRMSFVWRARCFATEEERSSFSEQSNVSVEDALTKLVADLRARGRMGATEELPPYDLAVKLIDEYIGYPLGQGLMPYNYCAAEALLPDSVKPLLKVIC